MAGYLSDSAKNGHILPKYILTHFSKGDTKENEELDLYLQKTTSVSSDSENDLKSSWNHLNMTFQSHTGPKRQILSMNA